MASTTPIYLVDELGDYIVDHEGNRIILGQVANLSLATKEDILLGLRLARRDVRSIKTFDISYHEVDGEDKYLVTFNEHSVGGIFSRVGVAYGQVLGTYNQNDATTPYLAALAALEEPEIPLTTRSVTMDGLSPTSSSQGFLTGNPVFDDLHITSFEVTFGLALKIIFDSETNRDAFLASLTTFTMRSVDLLSATWTDDDNKTFGIQTTDTFAVGAFASGTGNMVWG